MTNKEKAQEIAYENNIFGKFIMDRIEATCLEMAQWKDEQLESKLMQIIILAQQGYTSGATDEMILKQCKEVIQENDKL